MTRKFDFHDQNFEIKSSNTKHKNFPSGSMLFRNRWINMVKNSIVEDEFSFVALIFVNKQHI